MYDKTFISVTSHALDPSPCHKLSHLVGPLPLERDVLYGRPPNVHLSLNLTRVRLIHLVLVPKATLSLGCESPV